MKRTKFSIIVVLIIVGLSVDNFSTFGNEQEETVNFIVESANKVYDGDTNTWNFTVTNYNVTADSDGKTLFFFKIYSNDKLLWNEYEATDYRTWQLDLGSTIKRNYTFPRWNGPAKYKIKIQLYSFQDGTPNLETERTRVVHVTKVFISKWGLSIKKVARGTNIPSNFSISFANGGNDDIYNVSLVTLSSNELEITPPSQNIGIIKAGEKKTVVFSVLALATKKPASTQNLKFQITYNDFRGVSHTEEFTATVEVIPNPTIQKILDILSGVAIASAIGGVIAFYLFAKKSKRSHQNK